MKNLLFIILASVCLTACCNCRHEPIVQENQKLLIPPHLEEKPISNLNQ